MYKKYFKRLVDFILSLIALIVLSPVLLIVAMLVRMKLGSPILFKQKRPGLNEEIFTMYKFRSMTDEKDKTGKLLSDEFRLTRFGKILRKTSLDELPSIFNVLKGDMSIIGPRPLLTEYLPYYTEKEKVRHSVRPGLTGLAQINGRNNLKWNNRFRKDVEYVDTISILQDIRIFFVTILKVVNREDIAENTDLVEGNLAEIRSENIK